MLNYTFQSLDGQYPRRLTSSSLRKPSPFGRSWTETLELLERELKFLGTRYGSVVLKTAHSPYYVRNDGRLRADAGKPEHPGVVIEFDVFDTAANRYTRMSFECDQFTDYKANVRAIADALEALRKVDRYGVTGGGGKNQYEGYKALPTAEGKIATKDEAAQFISEHSGIIAAVIQGSTVEADAAFKRAAKKLHPDVGGDPLLFQKLCSARDLLKTQ